MPYMEENKMSELKYNLDNDIYENNLFFYTLLKGLIQCKLSNKQLVLLKNTILKNINIFEIDKKNSLIVLLKMMV